MKTVLITGGAGFIGSAFVRYMLHKYPNYRLVNVDALTYAGGTDNLDGIMRAPNHVFIKADICDDARLEAIFFEHDIDYVVNLAAQTHVDRSIQGPAAFLSTNVLGVNALLEAAMKSWYRKGAYKRGARFLQVSTDEVYGPAGGETGFSEAAPLLPRNPYAASKAAADLLIRSYFETYAFPARITRSSNNYGPRQHPEKLIPLMVKNCMEEKPLPVYGDGKQRRDWLHVGDHCAALDTVLHKGEAGEVYNVGGACEKTNLEVVKRILSLTGRAETLITHVEDRPGHDRRYALNSQKLAALGWRPVRPFEQGLEQTVQWYLNNPAWLKAREIEP